jgi:DNA-binding response OmpR family regulator
MSVTGPDDRRRFLRATDLLLEWIETLRLRNLTAVPPELGEQIAQVASEVGGVVPAPTPQTLADAHDHVFRLQWFLLRGDDALRIRRGLSAITPRTSLPLLSIPDQDAFESRPVWVEHMRLMIQRAHDRTRYLEAQARAAECLSGPDAQTLAHRRWAEAEDARQNWHELAQQAEEIVGHPFSLDPMPHLPTSGRLQFADLDVDLDSREVRQAGQPIRLTPHEYTCLVVLMANRGRVLTREAMQYLVNGDEPTLGVRSRALDVHLSHLRSKLGNLRYFESVAHIGFRWLENPHATSRKSVSPRTSEARREARAAWARVSSTFPSGQLPMPNPVPRRHLGR